MASSKPWSREQLLVAGLLYCRIPFGRFHHHNPEIIEAAAAMERTPSAVAMKLSNLASFDPVITGSGRSGLAGASAADRALWEEMHTDWPAFAVAAQEAVESIGLGRSEQSQAAQPDRDPDYTGQVRTATRSERVGQDLFRIAVLTAYEHRCCITGLAVPKLLVASHIVPWREDPGNRLNPANGLCLSCLHDRAFDIGLITVREDFTVAVSEQVEGDSGEFWSRAVKAFEGKKIALPDKFPPNTEFLARHRAEVFLQ